MAEIYSLNTTATEPLLAPHELQKALPATEKQLDFIEYSRQTIRNILEGTDPRLLLIMGPCSIHNIAAAREYAIHLKRLADELSDRFFPVMRVYVEKPRTALGWKGLLYDPYLNGSNDIVTGLHWTRQLLLDLADLGVPTATEFLNPMTAPYRSDLISWGCIGARTAASQIHRQMASGLPMPTALKNDTNGSVEIAINGALAASSPQSYIGTDERGRTAMVYTNGNPHAHIVLRGGKSGPNYNEISVHQALQNMEHIGLTPNLLIDCSHDNSNKIHEKQPIVFRSMIDQWVDGTSGIRGAILESNLLPGNQEFSSDPHPSISVTDPCLDWATTECLIRWGYARIQQHLTPTAATTAHEHQASV